MFKSDVLKSRVLDLFKQASSKDGLILDIFQYQISNNPILRSFVDKTGRNTKPTTISEVSFLPISFFKTHEIKTGIWKEQAIFKSSGTTGLSTSRHFVKDLEWYQNIATMIFQNHVSELAEVLILGLLPHYLERGDSSLVYMVKSFMDSTDQAPAFYLDDFEGIIHLLQAQKKARKKTILFGVSYALLDLAEGNNIDDPRLTIIETGGMKGRKKEMVRTELHAEISKGFPSSPIYSEYGMTELLSQSYARGNEFKLPKTLEVFISELNDPFQEQVKGKTGRINVIDLANIDTCSFISTDDLGRMTGDQSFEVLGRIDNSLFRGCNLLYTPRA